MTECYGGNVQILYLVVLGLVQGLTEFLPVSSSGHLVLLGKWFGIEDSLFISILLHIATLLSIIVVLRKEIWQLIRHPFSEKTINLAIATIPTCVIVLILMPLIDKSFSGAFLPICFLISAVLLFVTDMLTKKKTQNSFQRTFLGHKDAFVMGVFQGLAVFPGISRSGSTICAGLLSGAPKSETAKFSFLMSIPIIILSLAMEVYKIIVKGNVISVDPIGMSLSFIVAMLVGIFAIKVMLKLTQKANFKWFSLYLLIISILALCI